ncbi:hypothetical protein XENOCAPTIV_009934, partial [Xenoophorus captivus]
VKRQVVFHDQPQHFVIHSLNTQGHKTSVPVMVFYQRLNHKNNNQPCNHTELGSANNTQDTADEEVPILHFPKSFKGMKRIKRDWILPPLSVPENNRGPYPLFLAQIRSDRHVTKRIEYKITGPGANQHPIGLFTMNKNSGDLYVTEELDREKQNSYKLQAHAVTDDLGKAEEPMDIVINVIDQNDNKPVFKELTYIGAVPESSEKGFEVISVEATDADEPNTDNSDIQYRIEHQEPEEPTPFMFTINPKTGTIRVYGAGLDREKIPQYTLRVQAADSKGEGLTGFTSVIIKVTDSNDHAPVFTGPS